MKKIISILCLAAMLLPFVCMVSCGSQAPSSNDEDTPSVNDAETQTPSGNEDKAPGGDTSQSDGNATDTETDTDSDADTDADTDTDTDTDSDDKSEDKNISGLPPYSGPAFDEKTPAIYIETEKGASIPANKSEVNCTISLRSNQYDQCADNLVATIRTRGNGSLNAAQSVGKLPYKIKFRNKVNPFMLGDGKASDWVLLDHVGEQTMLRNYAARLLGDMLSGIPYSTNSRLVNVYLNGSYIGVYELAEQVEVGKYRIDIDDDCAGAENGFLVELDAYASDLYVSVGGQNYTVKSHVYSDAQLEFIREYLEQVDSAIYSENVSQLVKLVDINSLVDMYIVQEYAKNIDVGWSSFYMYRDVGGKLTFAPPWDFDLSFGNDDRLDGGSYKGIYVGSDRGMMQDHRWYNALWRQDWFRKLVVKRWKEVSKNIIPELIRAVRLASFEISADMQKNYTRWKILGQKRHQEPVAIYKLTTYKQHVDYLITWMENRKAWLDNEFASY